MSIMLSYVCETLLSEYVNEWRKLGESETLK